jgi:DNA-binding NtrC family response regulator
VLPLTLPPLRERREDIPELMDAFFGRFYRLKGEDTPEVTDAVKQAFVQYDWPGNVRELENACERIAQTCTCGTVRVGCLAANILFGAGEPGSQTLAPEVPPTSVSGPISLDARLRDLEISLISWALKASHGNKSRAAEMLQIKRSTLGDRIRLLGLDHHESGDRPASTGDVPAA